MTWIATEPSGRHLTHISNTNVCLVSMGVGERLTLHILNTNNNAFLMFE